MSGTSQITFSTHTKLVSTSDGDRFLCVECARDRQEEEGGLGVPTSGGMRFLMGDMPSGDEPCDDCGTTP